MSLEVALSFLLYAFVSGITPGPANLCSLSVAMGSGKSVAIKQWYGLFTGYTIVSLASVFIVYFISSAFENFIRVFAFVGAIYIAYLAISLLIQAFKLLEEIRNSRTTGSFRTGLFVQLTNVKIMVFCLTAITTYILPTTKIFRTCCCSAYYCRLQAPSAIWRGFSQAFYCKGFSKSTTEFSTRSWDSRYCIVRLGL